MELYFYKGNDNTLANIKGKPDNETGESQESADLKAKTKKLQEAFLKVLDNKNLSFLLGSGCSSYKIENEGFKEVGIPVMAPLAKEFYSLVAFKEPKEWLKTELSIDVEHDNFSTNLETFLSTLHSLSFYHSKTRKNVKEEKTFAELINENKVEFIIKQARNFLLEKCLNAENAKSEEGKASIDRPLIETYKQFYRKLLSRNPTLPRLNIFTTNYDLYSERAMDLLGMKYSPKTGQVR